MYKQLMEEPYTLTPTQIDNLTFAQFLLYFTPSEALQNKTLTPAEFRARMKERSKSSMTREEFLRIMDERAKAKKAAMRKRREEQAKKNK